MITDMCHKAHIFLSYLDAGSLDMEAPQFCELRLLTHPSVLAEKKKKYSLFSQILIANQIF